MKYQLTEEEKGLYAQIAFEQGFAQGIAQVETAKKLLMLGVNRDIITQVTQVSPAQLALLDRVIKLSSEPLRTLYSDNAV